MGFEEIWDNILTVLPFVPVKLFLSLLFAGCGAMALAAVLVFAPAVVTICHFFRDE